MGQQADGLEVVVEREDVIAAEASFRRILRKRNRAYAAATNSLPVLNRRNAFRALQVLCPLSFAWSLLLAWADFDVGGWEVWAVWAFVTFALSCFFLFVGYERSEAGMMRLADRISAHNARTAVRKTLPLTPFRVTYRLRADEWTTEVDEPRFVRRVRAGKVAVIECDGPVCCFFRRKRSQSWSAVVWTTTDEVKRAVQVFAEATRR